jgi:hypothetical protein
MNPYLDLSIMLLVAAVIVLASSWFNSRPRAKTKSLANDGALTVGVHAGSRITCYHESAPVTTRFLLVTQGVGGDNYVKTPSSVLDVPLGVCTDEPAATTDPVNIQGLLGADQTVKMVAAGAIAAGVPVITNGDGKIKAVPNVAGLYWCVGFSRTSATTSGDLVEVMPSLFPIGVDVIT